ncbi:MAG: glycosyltransferase family 2 protein [Candidatus Sungbacteria bacterium]|uniref:Glycosyltransferase family 2 protein n=1 Tax=Candidatus Sungiibacteriota bacterium TaxID=2750080 RepID=A0A931YDQ0_9BACT|nr:glycosyltransferase family 2 protein [Candidatus Sungbacteria bacterium]
MDTKWYLRIGRATEIANPRDRIIYRMLEIMPGVLAWGTLVGLVVLSIFQPAWVAVFIILFDVYWFVKVLYLSFHLRSGYRRLKENLKIDWWSKLKERSDWEDYWHLVVLPMYQEPYEVVRQTFKALLDSKYNQNKMIMVLALEERGGADPLQTAEKIKKEFGSEFFKLLVTVHPQNIPGELAGKGANECWAVKRVKEEIIDPLNLPHEKIIVSVFDVDTNVWPQYFALLTHKYIAHPNPARASFQPVPIFTNNIWEAPALARVVSFSSSFWLTMQQERPERQVTFSSHSMSFRTLAEVGFWQTNIVSEDSRIFWQCYNFYNGNYETVSLYAPVYMDAAVDETFWKSLKALYKQQRRWAWGAENLVYCLFAFTKNKTLPLTKKLRHGFNLVEGYYSWATNALIIFLMGWLPVFLGGTTFNVTVLSYNLPRITRTIMTLAMLGLVSSAVISMNLLPPRPPRYGRHKYVWMILQWALVPFTTIIFGSIPALDAQTRLMLGKYMGFWVTPKNRLTK